MDWYIRINLMREKTLIEAFKEDFDTLVVDAHILEAFPNAMANFILSLDKPFVIDPVTFKFSGLTYREFTEKRWHPHLQSGYLRGIVGEVQQLTPDDLSDNNNLRKYVARVLNYQRKRVSQILSGLEILGILGSTTPNTLIPPYSIVYRARNDEWFNLNLESIKITIENRKDDEKIYPVIPIYRDLLHHKDFIDDLINKYNIDGVDGYFVWIADFKEDREYESDLIKYIEFFEKLSENGRPIINFYGGYFSLTLSSIGVLNGFTHAICYADYRNPLAVGGGGGIRYYLPQFHLKTPPDEAEEIFAVMEDILDRCQCSICPNVDDIGDISWVDSSEHFMNVRKDDIENAGTRNIKFYKDEFKKYEQIQTEDKNEDYIRHYRHLEKWYKALMKHFP